VKDVLLKYCNASEQRINTDKFSICFSKRYPTNIRGDVKSELDIHKETLNEKYFGMPADVGRFTGGAFKYLNDRVWKGPGIAGTSPVSRREGYSHQVSSASYTHFFYVMFQATQGTL
jgi:hypothetical protein